VAQDVISDISLHFRSWTSAKGIANLREPLLNAVVARRRLQLSDLIPGCASWTVDKVCSLGLVRHVADEPGESGHLDIAVILLHVIRRELKAGSLFSLIADYDFVDSSGRACKTWQDFEDFVAAIRAIKVAAFRDKGNVSLCEMHAGAKLSAAARTTSVRVPADSHADIRVIHAKKRCNTATIQLGPDTFVVDGQNVEGRADEGLAAKADVVLNGISASAGDIFLRIDRDDRASSRFVPELEVIACRHRATTVNALDFDSERSKALGDRSTTSFFLFVSTSCVDVDLGDFDPGEPNFSGEAAGVVTRSMKVRPVVAS